MKQRERQYGSLSVRQIGWLAAACVVLMAAVLPARGVSGMDVGPKPTMDFEFVMEQGLPTVTITEAVLLECDDASCAGARPLEVLGPQGITCQEMSCSSMAYGYADYHRLEVTFSDGVTRQSDVFEKSAFHATYRVTVGQELLRVREGRGKIDPLVGVLLGSLAGLALLLVEFGLLVALMVREGKGRATWKESRGFYIAAFGVGLLLTVAGGFFSLTLPITVLIEILLGVGYAVWRKRPVFPVVVVVLAMNVFTQLGLWGALEASRSGDALAFTLLLEGGIWLVEALVLFFAQRKAMRFKEAALLSLALNAVSFVIGLALPF